MGATHVKTRSLLASFATLITLTAAPAMAADMRMPVKAPVAAPVYNWTGFYIGGHVGGAWFEKDWFDPLSGSSLESHDASGFIAGGQIGFNWQAPGSNWVFGVEAQASWADLKGDHAFPVGELGAFGGHTKTDFIGTIAGRIGYAWDRWLLYVKGGAAWAHDEHKIISTVPITVIGLGVLPAGTTFREADETRWGWTIGAGTELALGGNWSVKLEYNYMDFGEKSVTFSTVPPLAPNSFDLDIDQHIHVVKFGINYRFGGFGGPVVARY
jgi:outer membrane immunogenic protein